MPKLQSQTSTTYSRKKKRGELANYEKFWIIIPGEIIKELGWKRGDQISVETTPKGVLLKKE